MRDAIAWMIAIPIAGIFLIAMCGAFTFLDYMVAIRQRRLK